MPPYHLPTRYAKILDALLKIAIIINADEHFSGIVLKNLLFGPIP